MLSATALIAESSFGCCDQRACGDAANYRLPLHSADDDEGAAMIDKSHITGLVLAGGRGSRMGGVDKGLQPHLGMPLALHALLRLAPQVGETIINANRNLGAYESLGAPVWPDALPDYPGPLAGFLAGLEHCATPYLATVPCDSPLFPEDLVARLGARLDRDDAEIAMAATREDGELRLQPVFCLMRATVVESLVRFTASGRRKIDAWTATLRQVAVEFDDARAFVNANTLAELQQLQK
jgi:molybdopterin-guanine dinucleotide biosynthesis protein A